MSVNQGPLAIMGGAFDPVHLGHVRTAIELQQACELAEVRFVPSSNPPHREPHIASHDLRLQMLHAATAGVLEFTVDTRELDRSGPSFTHTTLTELRSEEPDRSLCMIVGMDAFLGIMHWHRWQEIGELAHLIVAHRPGWQLPAVGELGDYFRERLTDDPQALHEAPAGRLFIHEVTQLEISSSAIRAAIAADGDPRYLLPEAVYQLVQDSGCYNQPDQNVPKEKSAHA